MIKLHAFSAIVAIAFQVSANEGSSPGGTYVQSPKTSRYNLRRRNADETTHLRRQQQKRIREERNQKNLLRRQRIKARAQDAERKLKIRAMLDEQSNAYKEEKRKQKLSKQKDDYDSTDEEERRKNYTC
jgi:hypothetical protein